MPVAGEVTDASAVQDEVISIQTGGHAYDAYLARPANPTDAPGIIVIHEAFGMVDHIRDVARRFANIGYNAIAPNLYARSGAPDASDITTVLPKMFGLPDAEAVAVLEAAAAALRRQDGASGQVGVIGFCSGGRQTLLVACSSDAINAAVDCWGGFLTQATPEAKTTEARPTPIVDLVPRLRCPLYAVFGGEDQNPSPAVAAELEKRLAETTQPHTVEVFPGAGHAFFADYRPSYNETAAFDLWPKVTAFFAAHLR